MELRPNAGAIAAPIEDMPSTAEAIPDELKIGVTGYVRDSRLLKMMPELDVRSREAVYFPIIAALALVNVTNLLAKFAYDVKLDANIETGNVRGVVVRAWKDDAGGIPKSVCMSETIDAVFLWTP